MKINERNLNLFATNAPFDKEGYLNKRGELNKAFQRRYFVLKGNLLFYFEKKGDKEPLGLIILEGCTIELAEEFGGDLYCFQIVFCGNRSYILAASSQEEMESWMKLLTCAGYTYKNLIISDLQCRLEEIKNAQNRNANSLIGNSSTGGSLTPKSPLKRQNPFNRTAPPVPSLAVNRLQQTQFMATDQQPLQQQNEPEQHHQQLNFNLDYERTPMTRGLAEAGGVEGAAIATVVHSTFYPQHHKKSSLGLSSFYCSSDAFGSKESSAVASTNESFDPQLFTRTHEQYRQVVMKDILSYNAKRRLKEQPLIVL